MRSLDFYFDLISHNAHLAWHELPALAARHDVRVNAIPVVFGALLKAHGQLGPAEVPAKSAWMIRDVLRKAAQLNIEIHPPAVHPFRSLAALRAITAITDAQARERLISALFQAVWVQARDVSDLTTLARVIEECGLDCDGVIAALETPQIKTALRAQTDQALRRGAFGVPTMVVDDELFWGFDDFPALEDYLSGSDSLPREALNKWHTVPPGVQRKR